MGEVNTVFVRLFATFRDRAVADVVPVRLAPGATVADLRRELAGLWPDLAGLVGKSAVAVNEEYAAAGRAVRPGDDVALIPPVSGG